MLTEQLEARGIVDPQVLHAMRTIPRELFVPEQARSSAYCDGPLPIGQKQTISQPYMVALMTQLLHLNPEFRVLEIGTGCGYQTAVLAELAKFVYTIEIIGTLQKTAQEKLVSLGYKNVQYHHGDGARGWPQTALDPQPLFNAIMVTAAAPQTPQKLLSQLAMRGYMVIPVGDASQTLLVYEHAAEGIQCQSELAVRFVPFTHTIR